MHASSKPSSQSPRGRRRGWSWLSPAAVLSCALLVYVGSYYALSRRGIAEAQGAGCVGFFYVPLEEIGPDTPGMNRHYVLGALYDPINRLDHAWFGGEAACRGVTWSLGR